MRIDIVTIFPEMFPPILGESILRRAQESGVLKCAIHDLRKYTHDKRRTVDDRPYGGGPGMVMKPEPIFKAVEDIKKVCKKHAEGFKPKCQIILMSPKGEALTAGLAKKLSKKEHLTIICGHYEGVDERVKHALPCREVSIGDYVLTGGELPAMVLLDAVSRFIPGVIGHDEATLEESFEEGLLEYPQYTRPLIFNNMAVPSVLISGDHEKIRKWRMAKAHVKTRQVRPDLLRKHKGGTVQR